MVDDHNNVAIDSPETVAALEYAKQLYPTFIDGVLSWNDRSNNKAFLADQISLTLNGISIYTVAKNSPEPALNAIAKDMDHANMPIGVVGQADGAAKHPQYLLLRLHQISERGARISALHVGEGAGRRLGDGVERLYRAAFAGLERQSDLDGRPEGDAVPRRAEICARRRLFRHARLRLGRGDGRLRRASTCSRRPAPATQTPKAAAQRAAERAKRYYKA